MTFQDFLDQTRRDLDLFEKYWREHGEKDPEIFPTELMEGDWVEQFHFFQEREGKQP